MTWGAPEWLWELAGVGVLALVIILLIRRRSGSQRWPRVVRVLPSAHGLRPLPAAGSARRPWLLLLALAGVIVALARPQWGTVEEPVFQQAREVLIALDLSRSMQVEDVPPSRIGRARLLVQSLLDGLAGERVGLIVFAGTSFVQVPLSADYQILHDFLPELNTNYMPQGGTDYAGMLRAALGGFSADTNTDRFLIVLSDGESLTDDWRGLLPDVRERGVRVLALGVGTAAGGFIPDGQNGFVKDERGAVVLSKLETTTLQSLAAETRGVFRDASTWVELPALLAETVARGQQGQFVEQRSVRQLDRFQWALAPAVMLGLLGLWREITARPRQQTLHAPVSGPRTATGPGMAATVANLVLLGIFVAAASTGVAAEPTAPPDPAGPIRETVARLATSPSTTARDWRELAERTLVYGTGAKMNQQTVAAGAVRDALAAVAAGASLDARLTNWTKLREDLEKLLEQPPAPPPSEQEQPPPEENQENEQQQNQENNDPSQPDGEQKNEQQPPASEPGAPQNQTGEEQPGEDSPPPEPSEQKPGSELGELKNEPPPTPPPPENPPPDPSQKTRKFGGRPTTEQPASTDPETAVALQRLREANDKDSPARLFQLLEGENVAPAQQGRDW